MASLNKVHIIGNAGKDAELRYTGSGVATCTLTVATSRNWKNKDSGEKMEETEWHRVVFFDRLAEIVGEYVKKGKSIYIEGRLKTRKYEKDGVEHYTTEIVAESMQLLGSRDDDQAPRQQAPQAPRQAPKPQRQSTNFDDLDDIPF